MGVLIDSFLTAGIRFDRLDGERLQAHGELTDELRAAIRAQKPAILAELAAVIATSAEEAELRTLIGIVAADWPEMERTEALAVALADLEAALTCWRALAAEVGRERWPGLRDKGKT